MMGTDQIETVAVKLCNACSGGLLESDKFCRWCGVCQQSDITELKEIPSKTVLTAPNNNNSTSLYTTSSLEQARFRAGRFRPVSGPLVSAMLAGVSTGHTRPFYSRLLRKAVFALVSIPIWLLIVMLSPLDACAAAKEISKEY